MMDYWVKALLTAILILALGTVISGINYFTQKRRYNKELLMYCNDKKDDLLSKDEEIYWEFHFKNKVEIPFAILLSFLASILIFSVIFYIINIYS